MGVFDGEGERAKPARLLLRWAIVWLPLFAPIALLAPSTWMDGSAAVISALTVILLWVAASVVTVLCPHRGWHDRLAGTRVVAR